MAMNTQQGGNMIGGPVYTGGGHYGDDSSYGSQRPMAQEQEPGRFYQPPAQGAVPASRNF